MNILSAASMTDPHGKVSECIQFTIDDISDAFVLNDIMTIGRRYTLSLWLASDSPASVTVVGNTFTSTSVWSKCSVTFTAGSADLLLDFNNAGVYYIYHPQLEIGNVATDWTPAPEDLDPSDALGETNERVQTIYESVSELSVRNNEIIANVSEIEKTIDTVANDVISVNNEIADMKLESDNLKLGFQNITDNGINRVTTETGFTFDRNGMTIDSTDSPTKTQVTPDGMTVYKKDADGVQEEVLEATSEGVDATNLHAKTYLIIGGRSRFENYGTNRTGCFWIGG